MVVASQTLYNPRTNEVRAISGDTQAVADLYRQGWQTYTPTQAETQAIVQQSQQVASYKPPAISPRQQYDALRPYTQDNKVNLIAVINSGDQSAIKQAESAFDPAIMKDARYLAKTPVTSDIYLKMGPGTKKNLRVVTPVTLDEYKGLSDREKADHFIEGKPVKAAVAARLGPGVLGRTAFYDPSIFESITPWKEQKGEKATTARLLKWQAEIAVPFVYAGTHWKELSNRDRALNIILDGLVIGAIARKPITAALRTAGNRIMTNVYGKQGAKVLTGELRSLDVAATQGNQLAIRQSGERLIELGKRMTGNGVEGGQAVIKQGKRIITEAPKIASHDINISAKVKNVEKAVFKFAKDEKGAMQLGPRRVWKGAKPEVTTIKPADIGMPESQFDRFVKARVRNPRLSPEEFRRIERGQRPKTWAEIKRDLGIVDTKRGGIKYREPSPTTPYPRRKPTELTRDELLKKWKRNLEKMDSPASKELLRDLNRKEAASIVAKAKDNEARVYRMAERAFAELKKLANPSTKLLQMTSLEIEALVALNPAALTKILTKVNTATRTKVLTKLSTRTKVLLAAGVATQTKTQALTVVKTKTLTAAATAVLTRPAIATEVSTKTKTVILAKLSRDYVPPPPVPPPPVPPPPVPPPPVPPPPVPPPDKKKRKRRDGGGMRIVRISNMPINPGKVILPQGIVDWHITPPYRRGVRDIKAIRRAVPSKGKGAPHRGVRVVSGTAPGVITLHLSRTAAVDIHRGSRLDYYKPTRGPGLISGGRLRRQRPGTLLTA